MCIRLLVSCRYTPVILMLKMLCLLKSSFLLSLLFYIEPGHTRSTALIPTVSAGPSIHS